MAERSSRRFAALAFELPVHDGQAPKRFRMFPAGRFHAVDGRAEQPPQGWLMDDQAAARLIAAAKSRKSDYVIDYEHQTLNAASNGKKAIAACWFHDWDWVPGDGLYVIAPRWTAAAAQHIAADEYRYVSPVFAWHPTTGEVLAFYHAGLVNSPGLDGLTDFSALGAEYPELSPEEESMDLLAKLFAALGLPAPADEAAATTTLTALKAAADTVQTLSGEIAALKAGSATVDPAKFVPIDTMKDLQAQVAALSAQIRGGEVDVLVKQALDAGKLLPAQETWARDLGQKDVAALKSYLGTAPVVSALAGRTQTGGQGPEVGTDGLADAERAVCKQMGLSAEDFLKTKKGSA